MKKRNLIVIAAAALAALAVSIPVLASSRDGNDDSLPDNWEAKHDLSVNVNQARRDQDSDHRRNRGEFRHGTDPRDADTDGDGTPDGMECRHEAGDDNDHDGVSNETEGECHGRHRGPGGGGEAEPGDDHGGHGEVEAGDDSGGSGRH
jgi:hypothetical protein